MFYLKAMLNKLILLDYNHVTLYIVPKTKLGKRSHTI